MTPREIGPRHEVAFPDVVRRVLVWSQANLPLETPMLSSLLRYIRSAVVLGACFAVPRVATAEPSAVRASDSSEVVATVAKFHAALAAGDSAGALALLTSDALIVESGSVETRADYREHHLPADIDFARAVPSTRTVVRVTIQNDVAWIVSTSVTQGQVNGRVVNSTGAELTVLRRVGAGWQISAVHWSSRSRRPAG